jgi:D-3-phosphoglycerate dehydrogenase / 2-oxoglutarate reductase
VKKRVLRSNRWIAPSFDQGIAQDTDIQLDVHELGPGNVEAWNALEQAHVYVVSATKDECPAEWLVQQALIERCPELLLVSSRGAGYDTVDVSACTKAGIAVVNQSGGNATSVAEHTLGLILGVSRRMSETDRKMRREIGFAREAVMGHEIHGKTIGLIGIGHIGTKVAALSKAFGLKVLAHDPYLSQAEIASRGAQAVPLDQLLEHSDFVSLHCPRNNETKGLINAARLAQMKRGAILINTARGGIHDEAALAAALQSGHLAGAGLDVWDVEPPPLNHPLLAMENVYATFHTAGVTHEARNNMAAIAAEQIVMTLRGERPPRLINPEVWDTFSHRLKRTFKF